MKYIKDIDFFLFFLDFPHMGVPGAVALNTDGTANIYINTLYTLEIQTRTVKHELRHLAKGHFSCDWKSITEKELEADDLSDTSCVFADDFSWVEYTEQTPPPPARLPNVFEENPPGTIPLFASLSAFRDYMLAMRDQTQADLRSSGR